jgi:hypothetical protein
MMENNQLFSKPIFSKSCVLVSISHCFKGQAQVNNMRYNWYEVCGCWYIMVYYKTVRYTMVRSLTMRYTSVHYKTVQYSVTKRCSYKMVHVAKQYVTKWYSIKMVQYKTVHTDIMVSYITVHASHNQQGSTNPWIDWALSLT